MSNDCYFDLRVSGDYTQRTEFPSLLLSDAERIHDRWVMDFEKHLNLPGLQQWCLLNHIKTTEADVEIRGWTKYFRPPVAAVYEMSLVWRNLTFELSYSDDPNWDFQKWQVKAGAETLLEYRRGYFSTARPGDPVHHRWAFPRVPDNPDVEKGIRIDLRARGVFLTVPERDEPPFTLAEVTRRTDDAIAASLGTNFHQRPEFARPSVPFTLDERAYVPSLEHISDKTSGELHDLYQIAERDVTLTADELWWLDARRQFESVFRDNFMKEEYRHRFCPFLSDKRLQQLHDGAGPRAQELQFLIGRHGEGRPRAAELRRALQNPRWTERWPLWEQHARRVQAEAAALAEIWAGGLLPYEQAEPLLKARGLDPGPSEYDDRVRQEAESRGVLPPSPPPAAAGGDMVDPDFLAELEAMADGLTSGKEI